MLIWFDFDAEQDLPRVEGALFAMAAPGLCAGSP